MEEGVKSESLIIYGSWNLTTASLPTRSRLYNLEPIGIGTGLVECLTSYTSRLADSHCVSPAVLLGRTLAPLMGKKYWLQGGARLGTRGSALGNSFSEHTKAINSTGVIAKDWVTVLESLTLRNDLALLTTLPWGEVFTQRNLLRPNKSWCPSCYEEWRINDQPIYEPLLWTFRDVEVCPKHRRRLSHQCQFCGRRLPWLTRCAQPGYCSTCGEWLGTSFHESSTEIAIPDNELEWQIWVAKNLEEMIMAAHHLPSPPKERTAKSISLCINQASEGIMNRFACLIGKRKSTVWGWQHGKTQIPIDDLLRICCLLGVSLVDFLYAEFLTSKEVELNPVRVFVSGITTTRRTPKPFDRETTERALRTMLKDHPPLPMKDVARRLNISKRILYKHLPDLCKTISARNAKHRQVYYEKIRSQSEKQIRNVESKLSASGVYPSRRRVAASIIRPRRHGVIGKSLSTNDLQIVA